MRTENSCVNRCGLRTRHGHDQAGHPKRSDLPLGAISASATLTVPWRRVQTIAFEIEWHPYQLNPDMPPEGMDRQAYLDAKFGGRANADEVYGRIAEAAKAVGLDLDLQGIPRTPNTIDAHRLIHWAGLEGRQTAAVSRLFKAYFEDLQDIGERAVLLDIASGVGLDRAMLERLFETDADLDDIRARDAHARNRGVTGVPTFIIGQQHAVPGAQPPEALAEGDG